MQKLLKIDSIIWWILFILFLLNIIIANLTPMTSIDLNKIIVIIITWIIGIVLHKKTNIYNNKLFQICGIIYLLYIIISILILSFWPQISYPD